MAGPAPPTTWATSFETSAATARRRPFYVDSEERFAHLLLKPYADVSLTREPFLP
jgi:hypothetical protein